MAPVFVNVIRHFNSTLLPPTAGPSITTTFPPVAIDAFHATNAIPLWVIIVFTLFFSLLAGLLIFKVYKCCTTGDRGSHRKVKKEVLLWIDMEEGRGEQLVEVPGKLDEYDVKGRKKMNMGLGDGFNNGKGEEFSEGSGSDSQSQDREKYVEGVLSRMKDSDAGGDSPPALPRVPEQVWLKECRVQVDCTTR